MDILDGLESIKICTAYKYKGKLFREFPRDQKVLEMAKPVYQELPGWKTTTRNVQHFKQLPLAARNYLLRLQGILKTRIGLVSVGSARGETIFIKSS
jgi:adenylosuccinate synthase